MLLNTVLFFSLAVSMAFRRNVFGEEEDVAQSQLFVDKTSLIKLIFDRDYHTLLITVPKGFGKTTNLDMIRRFCEIQVDSDGCLISRNNTNYFKIFSSLFLKKQISSYLDVYQDKRFFKQFFAQYPVIHMNFAPLDFKSWAEFKDSFVKIINKAFDYHRHLLGSEVLSDKDKAMFRNFQFEVICKELEPDLLKESVKFLSSILNKYFNQKVVLFIDEVDSIIHSQIMKSCEDIEEIITFLADLISYTLNSNCVMKSILNSSSRLARVFTKGVKHINHFIFTEKHPFNQFYGFREAEVENLAAIYNLKNNMTIIRSWYNGYKITKSDLKMYSFHSISNVMFRKDIDTYLKKGKYPERFEHLLLNREIRGKIKTLIKNGVINCGAVKEVTIKDVFRLKEIFNVKKQTIIQPKNEALLFDYMLNLGYLTVVDYNEQSSKLTLKVPNMESKSELMDLTYSMSYFKTKLNLTDDDILTVNETSLDRKMAKYLKAEPVLPSSHYL